MNMKGSMIIFNIEINYSNFLFLNMVFIIATIKIKDNGIGIQIERI